MEGSTNQNFSSAGTAKSEGGSGVPPPPNALPPKPTACENEDDEDDEDDLDELDDLLDEFHVKEPNNPSAGTSSKVPPDEEEEFAQELQAGMADLLGELEQSPELREQFETLVKELADATDKTPDAVASTSTAGATPPSSSPKPIPGIPSAPGTTKPSSATDFHEKINRTMNRMKESSEGVGASIADEAANDDFLTELLKQMGSAAGIGDSEEEFSKMLLNMMEQLTNKDILYEPMKELADKYPEWLERNEATQSKEDMLRYREQFEHVKAIVAKFEEPDYRDSSTTDREFIVENMQKMQAAGSPPAELMGTTGLDGTSGAADLQIPPGLEGGCPVQ